MNIQIFGTPKCSDEFLCNEYSPEKFNCRLDSSQRKHFEENSIALAKKISLKKLMFAAENNFKDLKAYEEIEEMCQISITALKRAMNPKQNEYKANRTFLYKFTVGFGMSVEEANEYFSLCGGPLSDQCLQDYICIRALEDKDSIFDFINEMEEVAGVKIALRERKS